MHPIHAVFFAVALCAGPAAVLAAPPRAGAPRLVILPPWGDGDAILARAGADVIGPARAPLWALVAPDPGVAARLRADGAWVADGGALASFCGGSE